LVFGVREAAWPAIRGDLRLTYSDLGVLLTVPALVSGVLEPWFGVLADSGKRRSIIVAGGSAFAVALALTAYARSFATLLIAFALLYPASGAFVSLSQASLMDLDPSQHEKNMAQWVLAGSIGVVIGPLAFSLATRMGWGWRPLFAVLAIATVPLVFGSRRPTGIVGNAGAFWDTLQTARGALRTREVLRWLAVLHLTDLLGDVFAGFLAVYFVDVVHVSVATAALAVLVWTVSGLAGDVLLVPVLAHVSGVTSLRVTALLATGVYPGLLLIPGLTSKLVLLAILGLLRAGWYAIPQGRLYGALPGNSGVAVAVSNISGLPAYAFPLLLGVAAQHYGLGSALWLCLIAPIAILVGVPQKAAETRAVD
jgi:MFS transporter, FSR family, fosmidomycin resistance protein